MAHLIYSHGEWHTVSRNWHDSCMLTGTVAPSPGDTFSEFTSHLDAHADLAKRGLRAQRTRVAMWGEGDYRIIARGKR